MSYLYSTHGLFSDCNVVLLLVLDKDTKKINVLIENVAAINTFLFGGYFGVHNKNLSTDNHCGKVNTDLVQLEAMRYAIKRINSNASWLYGWKINQRITDTCSNTATLRRSFFDGRRYIYMGVIGPPSSDELVMAATIYAAGRSAIISPTATSLVFEDRATYYNVFRTVPSDMFQVNAMVDILLRFNWTYVSTVHSHGTYGQQAAANFITAAQSKGICIAKRTDLPRTVKASDYSSVITELASARSAKVVILFTTVEDTRPLLIAAKNSEGFTWLASTSWDTSKEAVKDVKEVVKGALVLQYANMNDEGFERYFLNLTLKNNNYTWFREFWSDLFNCNGGLANDTRNPCAGTESLAQINFYFDYSPVKAVIEAVETSACALQNIIAKLCPNSVGRTSCIYRQFRNTFNFESGTLKYLQTSNSSCRNLPNSVRFKKDGSLNRDLVLLNFDGIRYREVGIWTFNDTSMQGNLSLWTKNFTWNKDKLPGSICSEPCETGQRQIYKSPKCCFDCKDCADNNILKNNTCIPCRENEQADKGKMFCRKMPIIYIKATSAPSCIIVAGCCIGVILNTFALGLFIKHIDSRIVKASSRELSFVILISLYLCFVSPLLFLFKPSVTVCGLQRLIVGMSLTGCYTPLMLKTNRIYRIFTAAQVMTSKPALVSPRSQLSVCFGLLGLQLLPGVMWVVAEPPSVKLFYVENRTQLALVCKSDAIEMMLNLLPCFIVMAICTIYAFKTRKFPSNFNEAQSIGITLYISCFLWGVFVPLMLMFAVKHNSDVFRLTYIIANFTNMLGLVTSLGLFGPKLKRLLAPSEVSPNQ